MKKTSEVPEECPFIKTCSHRTVKEVVENVCLTSNWLGCRFIKEEDRKKYLAKRWLLPKEWKKILKQKR